MATLVLARSHYPSTISNNTIILGNFISSHLGICRNISVHTQVQHASLGIQSVISDIISTCQFNSISCWRGYFILNGCRLFNRLRLRFSRLFSSRFRSKLFNLYLRLPRIIIAGISKRHLRYSSNNHGN